MMPIVGVQTKISVSASLDANRTREAIMKQVEELIAAAEAADAGEDEVFGAGQAAGMRGEKAVAATVHGWPPWYAFAGGP